MNPALPKLVAFDLDGTLLNSWKEIGDRTVTAIKSLRARGATIVIASGRRHASTTKYATQLGLGPNDVVISYNGAMCRTLSGTPIAHRPVSLDYAQEIVAITTERSLHLNAYVDDDLYVKRLSKWTDLYYIRTGSRSIAVGDMRGWIARAPTKLLIIDHPRNISRLESEFVDRYRGKLYVTRTDDEYLEFMNLDANKGSGLATVAREIGVKQSETMCFGDNYNDLPMLRWAGRPVLMANARPDLLTEFTDIAPDCEEDGVGQYIEHLIQP